VAGRNSFGTTLKLPSGRYRAWYKIDGTRVSPGITFPNKAQADSWLRDQDVARRGGEWVDPKSGRISLILFIDETWWPLKENLLAVRTKELYEDLFKTWIYPELGKVRLMDLTPARIETWWAWCKKRSAPTMAAKAYRLLSQVLKTAARHGFIPSNPCQIEKAGAETAPERPMMEVAELIRIAETFEPRYQLLPLMMAWCSLRLGECLGLRRRSFDLNAGLVRVERSYVQPNRQPRGLDKPKTRASVRDVAIPSAVIPAIQEHLDQHVGSRAGDFVFAESSGTPPTRQAINRQWRRIRDELRLGDNLFLEDLRGSGATWLAQEGATTAELMERLGHTSVRAAMIYQHAAASRKHELADRLSARAEAATKVTNKSPAKRRRSA
jgi:integrase